MVRLAVEEVAKVVVVLLAQRSRWWRLDNIAITFGRRIERRSCARACLLTESCRFIVFAPSPVDLVRPGVV